MSLFNSGTLSYQRIVVSVLLLFPIQTGIVHASSPMLTSSRHQLQLKETLFVCTEEQVVLTCSIESAQRLQWTAQTMTGEVVNVTFVLRDNVTVRTETGYGAKPEEGTTANITSSLQFLASFNFDNITIICSDGGAREVSIDLSVKLLSRLWYDPIQRIADIGNGAVNVSVVWTDSERGSEFCELPPFDIRVSGSGAPFLRPVDAGATVLSLEKAIRYTVQAMPPLLTDGTPVLKRPPPFIIDTSSPDISGRLEPWLLAAIAVCSAIPLLVIAAVVIAMVAKACRRGKKGSCPKHVTVYRPSNQNDVIAFEEEIPCTDRVVPSPQHYLTPQQPQQKARKQLNYIDVCIQTPKSRARDGRDRSVNYAHVVCKESRGVIVDDHSSSVVHPADKVLDLDLLLIQLHDTSEEWRSLGAALGISPHRLDDVGNQCGAPDQCLVEVLDVWLREHQSRPTWGEVAEALDRIGWSRLAEGIKRVYTTGELPVMQDMSGALVNSLHF